MGFIPFCWDFDMKKPPKCIPAVFPVGSIQKANGFCKQWMLSAADLTSILPI